MRDGGGLATGLTHVPRPARVTKASKPDGTHDSGSNVDRQAAIHVDQSPSVTVALASIAVLRTRHRRLHVSPAEHRSARTRYSTM